MPLSETIGIWLGAALTLCIFSFLYRDNPFYKFAEHLFVGISAGYWATLEWHNVFLPNLWEPLTQEGRLLLLVPFAFGILLFSRFTRKFSWLSRWSMALIIGIYAGIAIVGYGSGDLILQIRANLLPLWTDSWLTSFNNILLTLGVITGLIYFFFSKEHKGALGGTAKVGIWFLMISFGASFGYTVMSRMSLLIGRVLFLLKDWLRLVD
jgi:nitrate reductase gamma subunit